MNDETQDMVDDLGAVVSGMDLLIDRIRTAEEDADVYECERVARAMAALKGAVLGFRDDVLGIIDG